jgi:hypothetical protein
MLVWAMNLSIPPVNEEREQHYLGHAQISQEEIVPSLVIATALHFQVQFLRRSGAAGTIRATKTLFGGRRPVAVFPSKAAILISDSMHNRL